MTIIHKRVVRKPVVRKLVVSGLALLGSLTALATPAAAALIVQIERVSDTEAVLTATGDIGPNNGQSPFSNGQLFWLQGDAFGSFPSGPTNDSIFNSASTLSVGGDIVDGAFDCSSGCFSDNIGNPTLYFASTDAEESGPGAFPANSTFSGALDLTLPSGTTFAAVGTTGNIFWGVPYNVPAIGTWTIVAGSVPEPATWALMLLGFGGIGWMLRSGRKALRSTA
jgi:hypothetical protein